MRSAQLIILGIVLAILIIVMGIVLAYAMHMAISNASDLIKTEREVKNKNKRGEINESII